MHHFLLFKIGFLPIGWVDIVDILLVAALLYYLYQLLRGTIALRVFFGFLTLFVVYQIVQATRMQLLSGILGQFMGVGKLAVFILFQQEIRRFLSVLGRASSLQELPNLILKRFGNEQKVSQPTIDQMLEALQAMSIERIGALIVFSPEDALDDYAETGDRIDALVSKRLLLSIFYGKNPLHDGAVIICQERIKAARCRLPISNSDNVPAALGMRHRAALGMSEHTEAILLIASEETGQLSLVFQGELHLNCSLPQMRQLIRTYLQQQSVLETTKKE